MVMNRPRTSRQSIPAPAALGLRAEERTLADLKELGWYNPESRELLWGLAGASDPNLALLNLIRLRRAIAEKEAGGDLPATAQWSQFDTLMRRSVVLRTRVFALLGGSSMLGDHLVANPEQWPQLAEEVPTAAQMYQAMLASVGARPEQIELPEDAVAELSALPEHLQPAPAAASLDGPGLYRAQLTGREAEVAMQLSYRGLIMRIAAADLAGTYPKGPRQPGQPELKFQQVAEALSDLADAALTASLAVAVATVYPNSAVSSRLSVIAMGKCGARELNYISDVDVIFVAEPADAKATRLAGEFIRTSSRCFFEVDAALRPEGKSGALVRTLDSHVAYYKRWAETWEFQALLKARPMTGDTALGRHYVEALSEMVWTASQRDSFVEDVQKMRSRVVQNVPEELRPRELKLGRGGLRDVEFAVQLLQMVHGRYDHSLRVTATVAALDALVQAGFVGREDGAALIEAYEFMRLLEHRLQLQKMRRTHLLPPTEDRVARRWLGRAAGLVSTEQSDAAKNLDAKVRATGGLIRSLHKKLFFRPLLNSVVSQDIGTLQLSADAAKRQLAALGYLYPDRAWDHLSALAAGSSRKSRIQAMLLPTLMEWLSETSDPDAGLLNYRKLSEALFDQQWFLRMLRDEGVVGQRLMRVLGTSPYASELIMQAPSVIKRFGDGASGPKLLDTDPDSVGRSLVAAAGRHADPARAISVARSLRREELARIAAADLFGLMDVQQVCRSLSLVWDNVLEAALSAEIRGWVSEHPDEQPPGVISVIGMGRLGGAELGYGSDADVMFICDPRRDAAGQAEVSDAEVVKWATRICDSLRRRLAKPSQDPPLEVDVDLRPEGRSGPIVRTLESYISYYERWAETWELQALLRATWIAGDKDLGLRFLHAIDPLRYPDGGASPKMVQQVRRMKARVDSERLPRGADRRTHTKLGSGALTDIEWTVQLLILLHAHQVPELHNTSTLECLAVLREHKIVDEADALALESAWLTATQARNALVLTRGKRTDQLPQPGPQLAQVAGAAGWNPTDSTSFMENYLRHTRHARRVVDRVFWGEDSANPI